MSVPEVVMLGACWVIGTWLYGVWEDWRYNSRMRAWLNSPEKAAADERRAQFLESIEDATYGPR